MRAGSITRREGVGLAGLAAGLMAAAPARASAPRVDLVTRVDFKDPKWNRDTYIRMDADIDPTKEKCGWLKGTAYGVRPNEKVRPLFKIEGFSFVRTRRLEDGSWRRLLREVVFYRDLDTNEILKTWRNPYTDEDVRVVPVANDPFNFTIGEYWPDPPSYGGLNTDKPPKRPYVLDWSDGPNGTLILNTDINLFYPSAMQPAEWPRESPGPFTRATELFTYVVKRADVENASLTNLPIVGSWGRVTPWLPWMLMGAAPGNINYFSTFATLPGGLAQLPPDLVAAAREISPKFLSAPTEDYGPSLSSLENYKLHNTPAPVPQGWTPPQPPPLLDASPRRS